MKLTAWRKLVEQAVSSLFTNVGIRSICRATALRGVLLGP